MNVVTELPDGTIEIHYPEIPPEPTETVTPTVISPEVWGDVVIRRADGTVVMDPATGEDLTERRCLQRSTYQDVVVKHSTPDRVLYDKSEKLFLSEVSRRILASTPGAKLVGINLDIPDLTFRTALVRSGDDVSIDMKAARLIQKERIRAARAACWPRLDAMENEAVSKQDEAMIARARKAKQAMRNLLSDVDEFITEAKTPEQLKAVWPDALDQA